MSVLTSGAAFADTSASASFSRVVATAFAFAFGLPLFLPVAGLKTIPLLAQVVAVMACFLILPPQMLADAVGRRRGSALRLAVYVFAGAAILAWILGTVAYGPSMSTLPSLINWIALGAVVVCGQVLLGRVRYLELLLGIYALSHAVLAGGIAAFLVTRFGGQLLTSTDRGPFQLAARMLIATWPNYFGIALGIAMCIPLSRTLQGKGTVRSALLLLVLGSGLLLTFSRTALVGFGAALIAMLLVSRRAARLMSLSLVVVALLVAIGALIPAIRFQFVSTFVPGSSQQVGVIERYAFAVEALRLWREHPLFGIGFGRFDEFASFSRVIRGGGAAGVALGSVHNEYVTTLLKGGILASATLLALFVVAARTIARVARSGTDQERALGVAGLGMFAVLAVAGMAAESFRTLSVSAPLWALIGGLSVLPERKGMRSHAASEIGERA